VSKLDDILFIIINYRWFLVHRRSLNDTFNEIFYRVVLKRATGSFGKKGRWTPCLVVRSRHPNTVKRIPKFGESVDIKMINVEVNYGERETRRHL